MNRLLPPTLVWLLLLVTVPLGLLLPAPGRFAWPWRVAGLVPLIGGLQLTMSGNTLFARSGTNIGTFKDPILLVTSGPFAHTRNPMYLGLTIFLMGVALVVGSLTAWLAPVAFAVAADRFYIPFEERRMQATFGSKYNAYRARVPRWIGRPVERDNEHHDNE